MMDLPPVAPSVGMRDRVRLGRDYYVRVLGNDYSVDPTVIGRFVDITAGLTEVTVTCAGKVVAAHERCWDTRGQGPASGGRAMSTTAGKDLTSEIAFLARELKTPVITETFTALGTQARAEAWSHEEYLAAVLGRGRLPDRERDQDEDLRGALPSRQDDRGLHLRPRPGRHPRSHRSPGHDHVHRQTREPRPARPTRDRQEPPRHRFGIKAAEASHPVAFDTATGWIARLATAHAEGRLDRELRKLNRYRLLVIDEVGYLPFDATAASLFFQLIASRYETGSVIMTSNLSFSRWGETLGDDVVAAATIDRLIHHAHVIALDGDSYRTRGHRATTPPPASTNN